MSSSRSIKNNSNLSRLFFLAILFIHPVINHAKNKEVIYSETYENNSKDSDNNATIIFDELIHLRPGGARHINTEIRYGHPDSRYYQLSLIRGGGIGNKQIIKAPVGTRIVLSYSPNMALRCVYFDITALGESTVKFNQSFGYYTTFHITNTKTLKPMFKSEYNHIISDNYYHCPWPTP